MHAWKFRILAIFGMLISTWGSWIASTWRSPQERVFEAVWSILNENYYDPTMNDLDWAGVRRVFGSSARTARTEEELYDNVLDPMIRLLESSHLKVAPAKAEFAGGPRPLLGIVEPSIGQCLGMVVELGNISILPRVVALTRSSPLRVMGVEKGWRLYGYQPESTESDGPGPLIEFIDRSGQPHQFFATGTETSTAEEWARLQIATWWDSRGSEIGESTVSIDRLGATVRPGRASESPFISAVWLDGPAAKKGIRTGQILRSMTASKKPNSAMLSFKIKVVTLNNQILDFQGQHRCDPEPESDITVKHVGEVLYLRFDRFNDAVARRIRKGFNGKPKIVVIDLRANSGGSSLSLRQIAGAFTPSTSLLGVATGRKSIEKIYPIGAQAHIPGRILVLTSRSTLSSGEVLAASLRRYRGATIFGNRTAGAVLLSQDYPLPGGA